MNAIILAAGMGTRLRPITLHTPKSLVKVNNKPLIETQIEYLREIGVQNITVVVGYLAEQFDYLVEKYNVKIIFNEFYNTYNNIYTMTLVMDNLQNSYVIDADVFMTKNFLLKNSTTSLYFSGKKDTVGEWALDVDANNRVYNIHDSNGEEYIMSGVSYWTTQDAKVLAHKLQEKIKTHPESWEQLYWDDIVKENLSEITVKRHQIACDDWYEIDSLEDYNAVLAQYR